MTCKVWLTEVFLAGQRKCRREEGVRGSPGVRGTWAGPGALLAVSLPHSIAHRRLAGPVCLLLQACCLQAYTLKALHPDRRLHSRAATLSPPNHRICKCTGQAVPAHVKVDDPDAIRLEVRALRATYLGVCAGHKEGLLRKEVQGGQPGAGGTLSEHWPPAQLLNSPSAGKTQDHRP